MKKKVIFKGGSMILNLMKLFLGKGYCKGCVRKGQGKCKIVVECVSRRKVRKDKGQKREIKEQVESAPVN